MNQEQRDATLRGDSRDGEKAFGAGRPLTDCPWPAYLSRQWLWMRGDAWRAGWRTAERAAMEQRKGT